MRRAVGSLIAVGAVGESLPHEGSKIDLDPKEKDGFGRPLARIHSFVDAMNVKRLQAMGAAARGLLKASGAIFTGLRACTHDASPRRTCSARLHGR
jgi:hypothetical protein